MNKRILHPTVGSLAGVVALALAFGVYSPGFDGVAPLEAAEPASTSENKGGSVSKEPAPETSPEKAAVSADSGKPVATTRDQPKSGGGPKEGIKVHGHWTITVRNPDGTVASRREFENALTTFGANALSRILAREETIISWEVSLNEAIGVTPGPCASALHPAEFNCRIQEPISTTPDDTNVFKNLTLSFPTLTSTGSDAGKFVLSGSAMANRDSNIATVSTSSRLSHTGGAATATLTSTNLSPSLPVLPDQLIQVTVAISFSTLP